MYMMVRVLIGICWYVCMYMLMYTYMLVRVSVHVSTRICWYMLVRVCVHDDACVDNCEETGGRGKLIKFMTPYVINWWS